MCTRNKNTQRLCEVKGCGKKHSAKGFCNSHYERWKAHGNPLGGGSYNYKLSFDAIDELKEHLFKNMKIMDNHVLATPCWEWARSRNTTGYGHQAVGGKLFLVSRLSANVFKGFDLKSPLCVLHKCDNPPCFNPDHLFFGTRKDNSDDMKAKGRERKALGSRNNKAKLTEADVRHIRSLFKKNVRVSIIAKRFLVSKSTIFRIKSGSMWSHLLNDA